MQKKISELLEFGILNIDKPSGPTSFSVSEFICKKLGLRKTSHFGTLDPKVTGVLPIALNRACKLTGFFLGETKEYVGIMRMHEDVELHKIKKVIDENFLGKIKQIPPVKSRVKRQEREREIYEFELLEKNEEGEQSSPSASPKRGQSKDILFRVKCQGGTYIRKLVDDLGKELEIGAHMLELRRTNAGIFSEQDKEFTNLYDFEKAVDEYKNKKEETLRKLIIPAEEAIKKIMPVVQIKKESIERLYTGKIFRKEDLIEEAKTKQGNFAAFAGEKFIGIYKLVNEKEVFAKPEFVLQPVK